MKQGKYEGLHGGVHGIRYGKLNKYYSKSDAEIRILTKVKLSSCLLDRFHEHLESNHIQEGGLEKSEDQELKLVTWALLFEWTMFS